MGIAASVKWAEDLIELFVVNGAARNRHYTRHEFLSGTEVVVFNIDTRFNGREGEWEVIETYIEEFARGRGIEASVSLWGSDSSRMEVQIVIEGGSK